MIWVITQDLLFSRQHEISCRQKSVTSNSFPRVEEQNSVQVWNFMPAQVSCHLHLTTTLETYLGTGHSNYSIVGRGFLSPSVLWRPPSPSPILPTPLFSNFNIMDMDLYMSSLGTLVSEQPCCVFYARRHQVYCGLTYNVVFCWYSHLTEHTHTKTKTHSTLGGQ